MIKPRQFSPLIAIRERKCLEILQMEHSTLDMRNKARAELTMYERYRRDGK